MMNPSAMRNLTLASAKHLVTQGHITPAHHAKIKKAVMPKAPMMAQPGMQPPGPPKSPVKFPAPMAGPVNQAPDVPMGALDAQPAPGGNPQMPY